MENTVSQHCAHRASFLTLLQKAIKKIFSITNNTTTTRIRTQSKQCIEMTKNFFLISILLICISILLQNTSASFVKLTSGRAQCFIEDLNENTQALVHYKFPCRKENPQNKLKIEISDPFGNLLLQQDLENWDGVVPFKSLTEIGGIYEICFQAYLPQLPETNLYVDVEVDDDAKHYDKLESKDRLQRMYLIYIYILMYAHDFFVVNCILTLIYRAGRSAG